MVGPAPSRQGGIAAVVRLYALGWDQARYDLRHIASAVEGTRWRKLGVALRAWLQFAVALLVWRPALIHIHFGGGASFYRKLPFIALARLAPAKLILHVHASDIWRQPARRPNGLIGRSLAAADQVLILAQSWASIAAEFGLKRPALLLPNPVECPAEPAVRAADDFAVLTLGRLGRHKGTFDLLRAIPRVLAACPQAKFWLAGTGELEEIERQIGDQPWAANVRLLGWLDGPAKAAALRAAAVFALPSYGEGLPMALLEAMAYGLPAVASQSDGFLDAVQEGENGYLVPAGDVAALAEALGRLLADGELRCRMGAAGRQRALACYDLPVVLERLYAIYAELLETASEAGGAQP